MTLPVNKATTPFKTMDIKTALLSGASRKRKSTSQISKDEPKSKKPSVENGGIEDAEVLDEASGITVVLQTNEIDSTLGDCKENKDTNAAELEYSQDNPKDNKCLNTSKEEKTNNLEKKTCSNSDNEVELLSDVSTCDELNKSANVSLNTSGLSITGEDNEDEKLKDDAKQKDDGQSKSDGKSQTDSKEKIKKKKMTPEEAQKRAKKREELQKEKLLKKQEFENKKKERQLEKEQKLKEKQLKKEREEIERKERERIKQEKKEQEEKERLKRQQEKEEKAKIKQMQLEQKLEEKKKKEEMRLKKEEEDKRAKLEKEQKEKEKQERAKAAFAKFFLKAENSTSTTPSAQTSEKRAFLPFQVSDDMTLAPVVPPAAQERFDKKQFDHYLEFQDGKKLYLDVLRSGTYKDVRHRKKNKTLEDSEVIIIDQAQAELGLHPKLLQFHENVRPPYWGTWRKKSKNIHARNPFGQDEMFDYEVDSDDEWDEGGPGESLSGSENEVESEDEYEVDNEFFVPHGYLSDEEEKKEDDDEEVNDPEKRKALLKLKLQEFEMERKKKTTELKPIILGCYFANDSAFQDTGLQRFLEAYSAEFLTETPIPTRFTVKSLQSGPNNNASESPKSANNANSAKKPVPEKALPDLIRLVHGSVKNRKILAEEFQKFWSEQSGEKSEVKQDSNEPSSNSEAVLCKESVDDVPSDFFQISLKQIRETIKEIASYGKCPDTTFKKCCWWVQDTIREKYGLLDAPIPNQWKYMSQKESEPSTKNNSSIKGFLSSN